MGIGNWAEERKPNIVATNYRLGGKLATIRHQTSDTASSEAPAHSTGVINPQEIGQCQFWGSPNYYPVVGAGMKYKQGLYTTCGKHEREHAFTGYET